MACTVTSITPNFGAVGDTITIAGTGFGAVQGASTVAFNGTAVASYTSWSDTQIVVVVPAGATSGRVLVTVSGAVQTGLGRSWFEIVDTSFRSIYDLLAQDETADSSPEDERYADARDYNNLLHLIHNAIPRGLNELRLTGTTGVPVTTSDVTGATSVYHTPKSGSGSGRIALPLNTTATLWGVVAIAEQTIPLGTITADKNYDVFVYVSGSTVAYELVAWTNDTTRATALAAHGGAWLKTGALNERYIGTLRTTSTTTTEDSKAKRFLWNESNRAKRFLSVVDTTNSWTWSSTTFHQANASASNQVAYVCGLVADSVRAVVYSLFAHDAGGVLVSGGIGIDSTSTNSAQIHGASAQTFAIGALSMYVGNPGIGYHYLAWLEAGAASGTTTWYGDANNALLQSGLEAEVFA